MKLEFIQELTESRLFYNASTLKGMKMSKVAELVYYILLALEILRRDDKSFARSYASKTISHQKFPYMSSSQTELYNLLVVLSNPNEYDEEMKIDIHPTIPLFALKRYLLDMGDRSPNQNLNRALFRKLESGLKLNSGHLRKLRRAAVDWERGDDGDHLMVARYVYNYLRSEIPLSDIYKKFSTNYRKYR